MVYKVKTSDNIVNCYDVTFDKEKLKEIFYELGEHQYNKIGKGGRLGYYTFRFPATEKIIKKRIINSLHPREIANMQIIEDSINYNKKEGYVKYDFIYISHTELYKLINIIINDFSLLVKEKNRDIFRTKPYVYDYRDCVVIDKLLNYMNSPELTDTPEPDKRVKNPGYDYKKVKELYKKTLESCHFKLSEIIEQVDNQESINGEQFKTRKLINDNKDRK